MRLFAPNPKKLARLRAARKRMSKFRRTTFLTLLVAVSLHFQAHLLEHNPVDHHAAEEGAFTLGTGAAYGKNLY